MSVNGSARTGSFDLSSLSCSVCGEPARRFIFGQPLCESASCLERAQVIRGGPAGHRQLHFASYRKAREYLDGCGMFSMKPGLERIRYLLDFLNHPEHAYTAIHVAGTNGKGTTAALAARILSEHGISTGCYLSPHLRSVRERIAVDGTWITRDAFRGVMEEMAPCFGAMEAVSGPGHPSYFEILTAMALRHFAEGGCRAAVIEVGMGGRWDATNCIDAVIPVITSVGLDHTDHLGATKEAIAGEKAQIARTGAERVICGIVPDDPVFPVIEARANEIGSTILALDRDIHVSGDARSFSVSCPYGDFDDLSLSLRGEQYVRNAALSVTAAAALLHHLHIPLDPRCIRAALTSFSLPGRMQELEYPMDESDRISGKMTQPLTRTFLLDGAHNPDAVRSLVDSLEDRSKASEVRSENVLDDSDKYFRPCTVIFGVMQDKDITGMLREIARLAPYEIVFCSVDTERATSSHSLLTTAQRSGLFPDSLLTDGGSVAASLERVVNDAVPDTVNDPSSNTGPVLVCGSLHVVGEALVFLENSLG